MLKFSFRTTKAILVEAGSSARIGDLVSDLGAALGADRHRQGHPVFRSVERGHRLAEGKEHPRRAFHRCGGGPSGRRRPEGGESRAGRRRRMRDRARRRVVDGCREARRPAREGQGEARRHLRCRLREGSATAADPGADDRGNRLRGHADIDRHHAIGREEGRGLAGAAARLCLARRRPDPWLPAACHRCDRRRRHGACDRGLYQQARQEPDLGRAGARRPAPV